MKGTTPIVMASLALLASASALRAELLLALDARDPGPNPGTHWQDLSGRNQPFVAATADGGLPVYNAGAMVYQFGRGAQRHWFQSQGADSARFNFPTNPWNAAPDPAGEFTIVACLDNTGFTDNTEFWSKGNGTGPHQFAGVTRSGGADLATMEVGNANGVGDRAMAQGAGPAATLGLDLYVFHFSGAGATSAWSIYVNGGTTDISAGVSGAANFPGTYAGSADPLRIGTRMGVSQDNRFFGDIRFIETWSGPEVMGMTPADYSQWRYAHPDVIIPEPGALALFGLGALALVARRR